MPGAAIGAAIGGPPCDRYGRKFIYTYDLMLYMAGVLLAAFAGNFWMLLAAFVMTGIAVGAGVPEPRASSSSQPARSS